MPETAIPYTAFVKAGFQVTFATELGQTPECDRRMLTGWTQKLLGADQHTISAYKAMSSTHEWQHPQAWTNTAFTLEAFDLVFIPGGHDQGIRQILDSARAQQLLVHYFPLTQKPGSKFCAAICHGVQLLAHSKHDSGASVLHDVETTTLPDFFERSVHQATRLFLGDYYKTYGAGADSVAEVVRASLEKEEQFKNSTSVTAPFVVEDKKHNYFSGRWPGDAQALADLVVENVNKRVDVRET